MENKTELSILRISEKERKTHFHSSFRKAVNKLVGFVKILAIQNKVKCFLCSVTKNLLCSFFEENIPTNLNIKKRLLISFIKNIQGTQKGRILPSSAPAPTKAKLGWDSIIISVIVNHHPPTPILVIWEYFAVGRLSLACSWHLTCSILVHHFVLDCSQLFHYLVVSTCSLHYNLIHDLFIAFTWLAAKLRPSPNSS